MLKIGFVVNGKKGRQKRFNQELDKLDNVIRNLNIIVKETSKTGHAITLATELADAGCTHIIAVGGDGTLNETVNGVKKSSNLYCKVGMLTYGTANDFARTISAPKSLQELLQAIEKGSYRKLDLGLIERKAGELLYKRYFINIADLGIGAEVVKRVNNSSKIFGSDVTFFGAIIRTFFSYTNQPVTCITDDWKWEGKINSLVIANGKYFGSGLCIAPEADPSDGKFSIVISGDIGLGDYLKNVVKIKKGKILTHHKVEYKVARSLKITSPSADCCIEADGEFIGGTPVTVQVVKEGIDFIYR
ncbi:diacylglycerol kinase family lipid kinase [Fulvivirga sp. 29W222]|uniref:Diacylglycerol kinase family lipid kinase n=1 Tax=Fulvivirga marina TaxID=2494733 RepID=A0A937KCL9_9BACT|nr:diacylglycerol kinase family protein [Fulvivirga marina]MBL6447529.1 diacylglycerol kinase family lipid kinase [Fulvivirga marina]